jgi:hypothetical protein
VSLLGAFPNFDLIEVRLAIRRRANAAGTSLKPPFPRSLAAPSDLARQVMWSYTFYRPTLTRLHWGVWLAVDLLDV